MELKVEQGKETGLAKLKVDLVEPHHTQLGKSNLTGFFLRWGRFVI